MSKTRIKIAIPTITTRDEAEAVMNDIAAAANTKRKRAATLDASVLKLQEAAAPGISECEVIIKEKVKLLKAWATANPAQFPAGRKSIAFLSGSLGFRTGTPKLDLLNKKWNWKTVLEQVKTLLPAFIRETPEVDKEAIISQRAEPAIQWALPRCGLKVAQDESFYVEPKLTDVEAKQ